MTEPGLISMRDVALGYAGRVVLSVPSFEARREELIALVGENGSGKSTLLHALCGILRPMKGELRRAGDFAGGRATGLLPQSGEVPGVIPMTVREYVSLGLVRSAVPRAFRDRNIAQAMEGTGVSALCDRQARSLSGGQRRRMMLARAMVREPELLVVDEPESGLDRDTRDFVKNRLKTLASGGVCVVMATHDHDWARQSASRVYTLREGTLIEGAA